MSGWQRPENMTPVFFPNNPEPEPGGCDACILIGHCPRCKQIVCWGHHLGVEAQIALRGEELRRRMRPDAMFAERCPEGEGEEP